MKGNSPCPWPVRRPPWAYQNAVASVAAGPRTAMRANKPRTSRAVQTNSPNTASARAAVGVPKRGGHGGSRSQDSDASEQAQDNQSRTDQFPQHSEREAGRGPEPERISKLVRH